MDYNLKSLTGSSGYFSLDAAAASATKKPSTGLGSKRGRNLDADMMAGSKTGVTTGAGTAAASQPGFPPDDDDNTPAQLYSNASTSFTNAGVNLNTATFVPSANPSALYNQEQFNIEDYTTQIEDYLTGTAISDSLYDALKLPNPAYGGLEIVEDRPLTEQELKQYAPLLDLMNNDITVEELGDMDREDQEAFLKAIGTTGLTMPPRDSVFVGGEFDVATTEEEFVRDLLNAGLDKQNKDYWSLLTAFKYNKEEAKELLNNKYGVVDLTPPEAADQELIPTTTTTPTSGGLMSRPEGTGELAGRILDGKDGTTATKEYKLSKDELIEQAKDMFPDNPVAAAAFIATVEAESSGGKDMTENGYSKAAAVKKFVDPYKLDDGTFGPKMRARKKAILASESPEEIFEIVYGAGYTGNKTLGNTELGDGFRFIGRGPIQLTGRANYEKYGKRAGYDIVNNPELMATNQEVSMAVTREYLKDKGIDSVQKASDLYNVIGHSGGMKEAAKRWKNVKKLYESTYGFDWDRAFSPLPKLRPTE